MEEKRPILRLLNGDLPPEEPDLVSELFHQINRVIPQDQDIFTIGPKCLVREAIALMNKHGYSQVPVVEANEVLGVFSYRSFAKAAARDSLEELNRQKCAAGDLPVDDFLEQFAFASTKDEMSGFFDSMDRDNGLLIGRPDNLLGVVTPMDFLRYFDRVASSYVMLSEIELTLRALIRYVWNETEIVVAAQCCLGRAYGSPDMVPKTLEDMTFDNYQTMITNGNNWLALEPIFGSMRAKVSGKLKQIAEIRNDLFHFRREPTVLDHETLSDHRNWLMMKLKQEQARRTKEGQS